MDRETRIKRLIFRASHRGLREADFMVGGFCAHYSAGWTPVQMDWFEAFLEEQDVDILAWGMGTADVPARLQGEMMEAFRRLDYLDEAVRNG